jgi:hypothetical protein
MGDRDLTKWCRHRLHVSTIVALTIGLLFLQVAANASHDPARTATIFVQGFEPDGTERHGVFGDDIERPLVTQAATLFGMPTTSTPGGALQRNVLAVTNYYGDTPPSYYSASDRNAIAAVTTQWGGGVPRYAFIIARYAQYVMERSGAEQVNFVSASFGSLITRWLIEKDVGGLASSGKIARWMSAEGVLCGNWAASHSDLVDLWGRLGASTLDIHHMDYSWVETNLHSPRRQADSPWYGQILIGEIGSTNDVLGRRSAERLHARLQ